MPLNFDSQGLLAPRAANMAVATTLNMPDPAGLTEGSGWTPSMSSGHHYILNCRNYKMTKQIVIQGGGDVTIIGAHTTRIADGGPNIMIAGGDAHRIVHIEGWLGDASGGGESDGVRTRISPTPASDTILQFLRCRVVNLRGQTDPGATDISGLTSSGTHADAIQLAGGAEAIGMQYMTAMSRYAHFQLQKELYELSTSAVSPVGNPAYPVKTIDQAVRAGSSPTWTVTYRTTAAHNITGTTDVTGLWAQIGKHTGGGTDLSPSGWSGTYEITAIPDSTHFTVAFRKNTPPSSFTSGGTLRLCEFRYDVGDLFWDHCNIKCLPNAQQRVTNSPGETINAWRLGGRPDYKGFEDQTPLLVDANKQQDITMNEFWIEPLNNSVGSLVNPGTSGVVYIDGRASINTGVTPNEVTYPDHPRFTGKALIGKPPGGDFCPAWLPGRKYPRVPKVRIAA